MAVEALELALLRSLQHVQHGAEVLDLVELVVSLLHVAGRFALACCVPDPGDPHEHEKAHEEPCQGNSQEERPVGGRAADLTGGAKWTREGLGQALQAVIVLRTDIHLGRGFAVITLLAPVGSCSEILGTIQSNSALYWFHGVCRAVIARRAFDFDRGVGAVVVGLAHRERQVRVCRARGTIATEVANGALAFVAIDGRLVIWPIHVPGKKWVGALGVWLRWSGRCGAGERLFNEAQRVHGIGRTDRSPAAALGSPLASRKAVACCCVRAVTSSWLTNNWFARTRIIVCIVCPEALA